MNPFLLGPRERLADWKQLREGIKSLPEHEQLQAVANYWGLAPLERFSYDPENAKDWPTIWEMITANHWCQQSIAIGMEMTLRLSGWDPSRLKLVYINDRDLSDVRLVLQIDDSKWLNYHRNYIEDIPETDRITMVTWQFDGKHYKSI